MARTCNKVRTCLIINRNVCINTYACTCMHKIVKTPPDKLSNMTKVEVHLRNVVNTNDQTAPNLAENAIPLLLNNLYKTNSHF